MIEPPRIFKKKEKFPKETRIVDILEVSLEELFAIRNPALARGPFNESALWKTFVRTMRGKDCWVYWPTEKKAVRMLSEPYYFEIRTARNRDLITKREQAKYRNATIGIAGLSVGSSILSALVINGGPKNIKIADFDVLAPSNLNRIRAGIGDVGIKKMDIILRDIWRMDPFISVKAWDHGLTEKDIDAFFNGTPRLDVFIDEMDNVPLKMAVRLMAKKMRIPVLMATDNGDGVLLDVERFDKEPNRPIFHGLLGKLSVEDAKKLSGKEWIAVVLKIIGTRYMPKRHKESLNKLGKTLVGVPQLGTDALLAGSVVSLAVRKILNDERLPSGKYKIDLQESLQIALKLS